MHMSPSLSRTRAKPTACGDPVRSAAASTVEVVVGGAVAAASTVSAGAGGCASSVFRSFQVKGTFGDGKGRSIGGPKAAG